MNRRDFPSEADYLRHHRKCFERAQETGQTPAEAEKDILREQAHARHQELMAQVDRVTGAARRGPAPDDAPWMMRD